MCEANAIWICWECDVSYCTDHAKVHDKIHTDENPTTWVETGPPYMVCCENQYPSNEVHT